MKQKIENKLTSLAVKQNLLLWQVSQSFVDLEHKIDKALIKNKKTFYTKKKLFKFNL